MGNYHCYDETEQDLAKQYRVEFPPDATGLAEFMALRERLGRFAEPSDEDPLGDLRKLHGKPRRTKLHCPRLFVSPRQMDKQEALRVAWLANQNGFDYWLDILDPAIAAASVRSGLNLYQEAVLMAAIIEIALLNCTHVLAVMTKNVPGTMWMPYEYGRVKDSGLTSMRTGGWFDSSWKLSTSPEYFYLGQLFRDEPGIESWLDRESRRCRKSSPSFIRPCPTKPWTLPIPPQLP